jgi:5'-nucleotidase
MAAQWQKFIGGFLQYSSFVSHDANTGKWSINNTAIETGKIYHVAIGDFPVSGKEANLDFLNPNNSTIIKVYDAATSKDDARSDRLVIVKYLQKRNGKL